MDKEIQEAILENIADCVFLINLDGTFKPLNNSARNIYCQNENRTNIKEVLNTVKYYDPNGIQTSYETSTISRALKGEQAKVHKILVIQNDKESYYDISSTPIYNKNGEVEQVITCCHDITDIVQSEKILKEKYKQLEELKKEAEDAKNAKNLFLSNMSHELRTPLNGIFTNIQLLLRTDFFLEQAEYVKMLKESADTLTAIIDDLLDISKIEAGDFKLNNKPFELRETIIELYKGILTEGNSKGLEVSYYLDPLIDFKTLGDEVKLKQIINNLLSNAVKFTEEGSISFRIRRVYSDINFERIEFKIKDTGIGIDEKLKMELFSNFYQGDISSKKKYMGIGLGLAISKQLAKLMNGEIWFESNIGLGTTFYFVCDFIKIEQNSKITYQIKDAKEIEEPKESIIQYSKTVLCVEDNIINQQVIERLIIKKGYNYIGVHNVNSAISALKNNNIDLILMDIQLPEMNGYELTKYIRNEEDEDTHIPIIAITAYAMNEDREKCIAAGMDDYIPKPFDIDNFTEIIVDYIENR